MLLHIHRAWHPNIMKTFIVSLFHRKSHINNIVDEITKNKYSLNITKKKKVSTMWLLSNQFYWVVVQCAWVISSRWCKEACHINLQVMSIHRLTAFLEMKVVHFFKTLGRNYSTTQCNNSKGLIPEYENRFETNKIFQLCAIYSGYCASVPHDLTYCISYL
jgi:hypothetical protein